MSFLHITVNANAFTSTPSERDMASVLAQVPANTDGVLKHNDVKVGACFWSPVEDALLAVIVMSLAPGYWGKGATVDAAIKNAKYLNSGDEVRVILADSRAYVDDMGTLLYDRMRVLGTGVIRKAGRTYCVRGTINPTSVV